MNKEQNFIVKWIILGGLGWLIGQIFAIFITQLSFPNTPCNLLGSSPLFWLVLGGVFGFFQWIALRGWVDGMRIWIIATAGIFFFIAQLSGLPPEKRTPG
jgi:hypothetical protein